jgi:hypothetical protein
LSGSLGPVPIPDPPFIAPFPLRVDFGSGTDIEPPIAIHVFDQPGLKTEQRFLLGNGMRRFRIRRDHLACHEYDQLRAHWIQAQGTYAEFSFTYPSPAGNQTVRVRYENPMIDFPASAGRIMGDPGITMIEVATSVPTYTSAHTLNRFPDSAFDTALTAQVQRIVPLIAIQDRAGATSTLYLSNQSLTVDGITYLPRLATWDGISQSIGEAGDSARFGFGNADSVFTELVKTINLNRAKVQFALFHVGSLTLVKLWSGYALPWSFDSDGNFFLPASDGVFELGLSYPSRMVTRSCWKVYKGRFCPSTSALPDCPKSWEACNARAVPHSFGGVVVAPQQRAFVPQDSGTIGWASSGLTSVTVAADTVYQRVVQEVYTDEAMVVTCDVAAGRDESEFYSALGIVGEGPISGYDTNLMNHKLDNQPPHDPVHGGGWRGITGNDPAATSDFFALDTAPWNTVPPGSTYAAGLAFAEIRRTDEAGTQLTQITDRVMTVTVTGGIGGWTWTAPGARVWTPALANTIWVAVNVYLRAIGLRVGQGQDALVSPAQMETFFDVQQAIAMAAICDLQVDKLVGTGKERQYPFRGALKERKPLKDWLQEILNCCLGYYTFVNGKLWLGIRENSGVLPHNTYTRANILFKSLETVPIQPQFNQLTVEFGDEEFNWQLNNVTIYDMDQAAFAGTVESPQFNASTMTLVGVSNKSQAARIATTRLREEIGGIVVRDAGGAITDNQQVKARSLRFRTTVLGLHTMAGDIISLGSLQPGQGHPALPTGYAEGRVVKWMLNPDFSIDLDATPTTDAMYNLTFGPKPEDATAAPVPPEMLPSITGLTWMPNEIAPVANDPLYTDPLQRTFDLWQDYRIARDGSWDATIYVAGQMCINLFAPGRQPRILAAFLAPGGTLAGPMTVYVGITQRMNTMQPLAPSNLIGLWIPPGVTGQKVTMTIAASPDSDQPWDLWAGKDRRALARQSSGMNVQTPLDFAGPIHPMTEGMPEAGARKVAIAAKRIWHSGVAGVSVTGVTAPNQIQSDDFKGSTDNWLGPPARILSALADQSDGSAPLWNFTITHFDGATGTFTVTPDCVRGTAADSVEKGDVLILRSVGITATANSVTDPLWDNFVARNQFGSPGLAVDEEKGRIARILFGTGAGQWRYITGNSNTQITVSPAWQTIPDNTSVVIVEDPDWAYTTETSDLQVPREGTRVEIKMRVENLRNRTALVGGFLVDDRGQYSSEEVAPLREIFIYGQPPTVRVVGPGLGPWATLATDQTIRADTTENDVTIQLLPIAQYQGRTLYVVNDTGPHNAIVESAAGEFLFDGASAVTLGPTETARVTAG